MKFALVSVMFFDDFGTSLSGGHRRGATPVPIPNTEVKPSTGDGTNGAIRWESSKLPGFIIKKGRALKVRPFFFMVWEAVVPTTPRN